MEREEIRLECLKLACMGSTNLTEILARAEVLVSFVYAEPLGKTDNAKPASASVTAGKERQAAR